jgi:hypothetical protein
MRQYHVPRENYRKHEQVTCVAEPIPEEFRRGGPGENGAALSDLELCPSSCNNPTETHLKNPVIGEVLHSASRVPNTFMGRAIDMMGWSRA